MNASRSFPLLVVLAVALVGFSGSPLLAAGPAPACDDPLAIPMPPPASVELSAPEEGAVNDLAGLVKQSVDGIDLDCVAGCINERAQCTAACGTNELCKDQCWDEFIVCRSRC